MLKIDQTALILATIFKTEMAPILSLPEDQRPSDQKSAYAVQNELIKNIGILGGWKVGSSSPTAEPSCSPLPQQRIFPAPSAIPAKEFRTLGFEAEIAFTLGEDLASAMSFSRENVEKAIVSAHPAIEIVSTRFKEWDKVDDFSKMADLQNHGALLIGAPIINWQRINFSNQPLLIKRNHETLVNQDGGNGNGEDVLRLLVWLASHAAKRGLPLRKGMVITTGSWSGLHPMAVGDSIFVEFFAMGTCTCTII